MKVKFWTPIFAALLISEASISQEPPPTLERVLNAVISANKAGDSASVGILAELAKSLAIPLEKNQRIPQVSGVSGIDRYYAEITQRFSSCDYFIANGPRGYFVFEWYGGHSPRVGEIIMGDISSYGFKSVVYPELDVDGQVWVENFLLSYSSAMDEINDHCDLK